MSAARPTSRSVWLCLTAVTLIASILTNVSFMWSYPELCSLTESPGLPYLLFFSLMSLHTRISWFRHGGRRHADLALIGIAVLAITGMFSSTSPMAVIDVCGRILFFAICIALCDACLEAFESWHAGRPGIGRTRG